MARINVNTPVIEKRVQFHYRVAITVGPRSTAMQQLASIRGMQVDEGTHDSLPTFSRIVTLWFTTEEAAEFSPSRHGKIEAAKRLRRILRRDGIILESDDLDWEATYLRSGVVDCLVTYTEGSTRPSKVSPIKPRPTRSAA